MCHVRPFKSLVWVDGGVVHDGALLLGDSLFPDCKERGQLTSLKLRFPGFDRMYHEVVAWGKWTQGSLYFPFWAIVSITFLAHES